MELPSLFVGSGVVLEDLFGPQVFGRMKKSVSSKLAIGCIWGLRMAPTKKREDLST